MVIENYSPSVLYSSPPHVIDWMRQRIFSANNLTHLYSGSGILVSSLAWEDKELYHHTTSLPSGDNQVHHLLRKENISENLDKGDVENTRSHSERKKNLAKIQNTPRVAHINNASKRTTLVEYPKICKDKKADLYKTEMCRNWQEIGYCRYGKKCRYAHGHTELRAVKRHQRYKTEVCRTYHETGTCPYGVRCTFIHDEKSSANPNIVFLNGKKPKAEKGKIYNTHVVAGARNAPSSPDLSIDSTCSSTFLLSDQTVPSLDDISDSADIFIANNSGVTAGLVAQDQLHNFEELDHVSITDSFIKISNSSEPFENNSCDTPVCSNAVSSSFERDHYNLPWIKSIDSIAPTLSDYFEKFGSEDGYQLHKKPFQKNAFKDEAVKGISTRIASSDRFSWQTSDHRHVNIV
ncbi:hypothetical protein K450DRAFT_9290 [Umbelopsis ramanniana AG]|uniref:C3H1-type domain-containing protein n=1 Tax=Umbelopsis ramanniana AG TaxID=1314678 RepID=A0AAD5E1B6_UMBRA|nr:uncharacterized protein K450DRAFT_9290 [Umbelopsis ramanniana AG]KAI8575104.1 hypothetical protein K450DRAFT_9290 [Umbelopsis ramanniana AG]